MANAGTPKELSWRGDMRVGPSGRVEFVYPFEKAQSQINVEVVLPKGTRMPDGTTLTSEAKVAVRGPEGSASLPGRLLGSDSWSDTDAVRGAVEGLHLDGLDQSRLQLAGQLLAVAW